MKRGIVVALIWLGVAIAGSATDLTTISFNHYNLHQNIESQCFDYDSLQSVPSVYSSNLPAKIAYVELIDGESAEQVTASVISSLHVESSISIQENTDVPTSESGKYGEGARSSVASLQLGRAPVSVEGVYRAGEKQFVKLLILPLSLTTSDSLRFSEKIAISIGSRAIGDNELLSEDAFLQLYRDNFSTSRPELISGTGDREYVVITCDSLVEACIPLIRHKISLGISATIKSIEDILNSYTGVDSAERLRNYLKEFYDEGGKYVFLVGDETILPIRHAYHIDVNASVSIDEQLLCDLYFADLSGDWDFDGDGVYGERTQDRADLAPELKVGRLPVSTAIEIDRYTRKLIAYETNPGRGDFSYLDHALFFSSDEMRDYAGGGQHTYIAKAYPSNFEIDTTSCVEATYGADPSPTNVAGPLVNDTISIGYGIVNIIAHGRYDGYAVRTASYNTWPKSLYLADYLGDSHTDASKLAPTGKISFYYSLACDVGGFDEDLSPLNLVGTNFVQRMLTIDSAGAVAFVGYSRWGWVGSSYLLQRAFFDSLFAHPGRDAIESMHGSKAAHSYLRDLIYGQNFYGDPSLVVYTQQPTRVSLTLEQSLDGLLVHGECNGSPAAGAVVRLVEDTTLLGMYILNEQGNVVIDYLIELGKNYAITAQQEGAVTAMKEYRPGLGTDAGDDHSTKLPRTFSLGQNYPNPFNPSTTIAFDLPHASNVLLAIYNILGEVVTTLVKGELSAGRHEVIWNGANSSGVLASSGVYYYKLRADEFNQSKKMVLLK